MDTMKSSICPNCHSSRLTFIETIHRWNCKRCGSWFGEDLAKITYVEVRRLFDSVAGGEKEMKRLSLKDLEIRYQNIRKGNPKVKNCSVKGCPNPRDSTPLLGEDTCCAYHRLLFDWWSTDVASNILNMTKSYRRIAFDKWMKEVGKAELDKIVLKMMVESINWEC